MQPDESWALPDRLGAADPLRLTVPPLLCAAGGYLFGGWALALAVDAAQRWSGRSVRSLSCEFLSPIRVGDAVEVELTEVRRGTRLTHAAVELRVGDRVALTARGLLGESPRTVFYPGPTMPEAAEPETCPPRTYRYHGSGTAIDTLDVRLAGAEPAPGGAGAGRVLLWARVRVPGDPTAGLAVISDHVPYLIVRTVAGVRHATTVSAGLRLMAVPPPGGWVLLEVELLGVDDQFAVGRVHGWDRAGRLVMVADQTTYLRYE